MNGAGFAAGATVYWNGSPRSTTFVSVDQVTAQIPAADLAAPGTASVSVVNPAPGGGASNTVFFQIAVPTSAAAFSASSVPTGLSPFSVVAADFNGDRRLDLAVANEADNTVSVLEGNGDGTFRTRTDYATGLGPGDLAVSDFNRDGRLDLAVVDAGEDSSGHYADSVSILLGNGDGTFQRHVDYATGEMPVRAVAGDFNGDGNVDLAVADQLLGTVSVLLGNGDGTFQPHVDYSAGTQPMALETADFNGDGVLDLAVANFANHTVSILLGNGDGTFQSAVDYITSQEPDAVVAADFNGDGAPDLAVAEFGSSAVGILLGNSDGTFQKQVRYSTGPYPESVTVGDFNGDGHLDLALATDSGLGSVSVLLGNGDGTFGTATNFPADLLPVELAPGDFNGDGMLDVASADLNANALSEMLATTLGISPPSLTFPSQALGTTSDPRTVTLTNFGFSEITMSSIRASAPFAETNNCGAGLAGSRSCAVSVTFTPTVTGVSNGQLTLTDSAVGSPQVVPLSGTGTGGVVTFSPASLDFGDQLVGTSSAGQLVVLTNTGNATLTISNIETTGDYAQANTCGTTVEAGASCKLNVTFRPTTTGTRNGTMCVYDDGWESPQCVTLTGIGVAPAVSLSPASLTFGVQLVGTSSPLQPVTLTNRGTAPLTINNISGAVSFIDSGDTCPRSPNTLAVNASCTINVVFKPATSGLLSASVRVYDNAPGNPQQVRCSGTGTVVLLSPARLDFGTVNLGQSSSPQTVVLTNTGQSSLTINSVRITGTDPGDFSIQTNTCGGSLGAGGSCNVSVVFAPVTTGVRSASLNFYDNGGGSPQTVSLTGTGGEANTGAGRRGGRSARTSRGYSETP